MKVNEIIIRQDRVVYTLMLLVATLGLFWSFWERHHRAEVTSPTHQERPAASQPTANRIYVR